MYHVRRKYDTYQANQVKIIFFLSATLKKTQQNKQNILSIELQKISIKIFSIMNVINV